MTYRRYLRSTLKKKTNKMLQFRVLLFGLSTSPFVFTHLMIVIAVHLHSKAVSLFPYLDDWLSRNQNCLLLLQHRQFITRWITSLGLIINKEKSALTISELCINRDGISYLKQHCQSSKGQNSVLQNVNLFLQQKKVSAGQFLPLLGKLNVAANFVAWADYISDPYKCLF